MLVTIEEPLSGLADAYIAITRRLISLEAISDSWAALTTLATQVPGAQDAGITQVKNGHFETLAATSDLAERTDAIQYELTSGPCVDAVLEKAIFRTGDLRRDPRWSEFGARASRETGVLSMLSIRLFLETDAKLLVGLNMYSTEPDAFDEDAETIGILLATHGTLAVAGVAAREQVNNLNIALESRTEIGIAMGILMAQHQITRQDAFNALRVSSQYTGRKLHDLATEVAETGLLPLPTRKNPRGGR